MLSLFDCLTFSLPNKRPLIPHSYTVFPGSNYSGRPTHQNARPASPLSKIKLAPLVITDGALGSAHSLILHVLHFVLVLTAEQTDR